MIGGDKKKMGIVFVILASVFLLTQVSSLIIALQENTRANERSKIAELDHQMTMKKLAADNLREYLNCKLEQKVCDNLYPDAFEAIKKAKVNELKN